LKIKIPEIEITNINSYGSGVQAMSKPITITAELSQDLDE
jgi:hypothetical protein